MNEKMSKRRIQIIDFQKQEIEEKEETTLLIRLHIFYKILLDYDYGKGQPVTLSFS
jgi:hypothetical protein